MHIPIVSDLLGKKETIIQPERELNPVRLAQNIPINQPQGHPPSIEVVKEVSATEHIPHSWREKYRGFDLKQIGYSNLTPKQVENLRLEFEIYQDVQFNFAIKDDVFEEGENERRSELVQDAVIVENQARKAINGALLTKVLASTSINKSEIQAGTIQKEGAKPNIQSFLFR